MKDRLSRDEQLERDSLGEYSITFRVVSVETDHWNLGINSLEFNI